MNRRVLLNLAAFGVVSAVVIVWSIATLFEVDALDDPDFVTVEFESSPGLARGFEVAYLGHAVGSVHSAALRDGYSEIVLRIDKDEGLPAAVDALARRKSAIGEPFVDLMPTPGTDPTSGPRLGDGDRIPLERTSSPISYGTLFKSVDALLAAIDPDQVGTVVDELAAALDGRGDDLRRIIAGSRALTERTVANGDEIDQFLADLGDVTGVLADNRDPLARSIDAFDAVTQTLDETRGPIEQLLQEGPSALQVVLRIMASTDAQLVCTVDGLAALGPVTADGVAEALGATIADSGTALDITNAVVGADGYLNLTLLFSDTNEAPVYPERRPPPVAPSVDGCGDLAGRTVGAEVGSRADLGPGGRDDLAADGSVDPDERALDPDDGGPTGSSDVDEPDDPFLAEVIRKALPLLLLAALVALAWWLWKRRQEAGEGPGDAPEALPDDADETVGS